MNFNILILISCALLVYGQTPQPCKSPTQWEGHLYESDPETGFRGSGNFSYDGVNKQTRFIDDVRDGRREDVFDTLRIWGQKIEYIYDMNRKTCRKNPLTQTWVILFN